MKKSLCLLLSLLVILSALPAFAGEEAPVLPNPGEVLHGFRVTDSRQEHMIDATTLVFEHEKTGAQLLYLATEDPNCSFDISFRTPNLTNKGIPHVFEHITISGSEKYPSQNLFFPIATQTYNSFVNAMTYPQMTTYPLASLSDAQLLKLADYYLNGLFYPMIYEDERFFRREAWRYELSDPDAPLNLTGTVYNEMRGALNIQSMSGSNLLRTLFPGSILGNVNGGDPDYIPDMTWQELLDFHTTYYHPSNSLTVLYGKMDYAAFLELLDTYFSAYEKQEIDVEDGVVTPVAQFAEQVFEYPVEQGSPTTASSVVEYGFAPVEASFEERVGIDILCALLGHESSALTRELQEKVPGGQFSVYIDDTMSMPYVVFAMDGVDEADAATFRQVVDQRLSNYAKEGFDPELIDAMIASNEFSMLLTPEISNLGVQMSLSLSIYWAGQGTNDYFNAWMAALSEIKENAHTGYFESLLDRYFIQNPHAALTVTVPVPGLMEEKAQALSEKLEREKAAMSGEEISALVEETTSFLAWSQAEAPKELLESLQAVTADTLPEEYRMYEVSEGEIDGIRTLTAPAAVGSIGSTQLILDTSALPQEMLHDYQLYLSLLGMVDTENYDSAQLQTLTTSLLYGADFSAGTLWNADDSWRPVLTASWMSLMEDYEKALEIAREILFTSRTDDLAMIQTILGQSKLAMRNQINNSTYILQMYRAMGTAHPFAAYEDYLSGLEYYAYLTRMEALLLSEPEALVARLTAVREAIANRQNAVLLFAGNEESIGVFEQYAGQLLSGIEAREITPAELTLPVQEGREALAVDSQVQYNLLYASLETLDLTYSAKLDPLARLIYDQYLTREIRQGIGAYDNIASINEQGALFISYRDPSIAETYQVYEGLPEFVLDESITQEDLDRYIINGYSTYALPQGDLSGAMNALRTRLLGWPDDLRLLRMREIKEAELSDLRDLAPVLRTLLEEGVRSTGGSASAIAANEALFDHVIHLEDDAAAEAPPEAE